MTRDARGPYKRGRAVEPHPILKGHVKLPACIVKIPGMHFDAKKSRVIYVEHFEAEYGYVTLRNGDIYKIILDPATEIWNAEQEPVVKGGGEEVVC